jgi:protein tyrosine phosphatase (PTP) superfamily phosphohydrolase (DUF442 family)
MVAFMLVLGCSARPLGTLPVDDGDGTDGTAGTGGTAGSGVPPACVAGEPVLPDTLRNARDLGGTPLADSGSVACGAIYRGAALKGLSSAGCAGFASLGIRTVIDLRTPTERTGSPDPACVAETTNLVPAPMPIPYNVSPVDYVADLETSSAIVQIFQVLADEAAYPVFIHCTYGRDRTGVVSAVVLSTLGASRDVIQKEYALSAATVGAYPPSLAAVLDRLRDAGGVEAFLAAAGVTPDQIAAVRARLIAP